MNATARRVLYIHGLESGPTGRKVVQLRAAGFDVVSEQMPCNRDRVVRDPAVIATGLALATATIGVGIRSGLRGVILGGAVVTLATPLARIALMRRIVARSVEVQTGTLASHAVDLVVASSFGGAIALELLARGLWRGPTVLLCPAQQLVAQRARRAPATLAGLPDQTTARIVVVHGQRDETVPLAHSRTLVAGTRAQLVVVDDDHRLTATATPEGLSAWIARTAG